MKKCLVCGEEIQNTALKCRYCWSVQADGTGADSADPACLPEVVQLVSHGRKTEAMRRLREETLWDLKTAGDYIRTLERPEPPQEAPPKKRSAARPIQAVVTLVVAGVTVYYVFGGLGDTSSAGTNRSSETTSGSGRVAYSVGAEALFVEYEINEVSADAKYRNHRIIVSGVVREIGKDILDSPYVLFKRDRDYGGFTVEATFPKSSAGSLARLVPGQDLSVTCVCTGKLGNVILKGCSP